MPSRGVREGNDSATSNMFQAIYPGTDQQVTVTASSAQSAAFGSKTSIARFCASTDCFILFGANPTATTAKIYLPSGIPEYLGVIPGQKVAVIRSTADGILSILEGSQT